MAQKRKQIIIIGGGTSVKKGLSKGLKEKIKGKFIIGCNYAFNFFDNLTLTTYVDRDFYKIGDGSFTSEQKKRHRDSLEKLQLIIGQEITDKNIEKFLNTYYISCSSNYTRNLKGGIYKASLTGLYSLSFGIYLLDEGEIFLLGFDFGALNNKTHFYQGEINHRGINKTNYYDMKARADKDFSVYRNETKIKIYNVSLNSRINIFPKISYDQFFKMLDKNTYNREDLKNDIIKKLEVLK